jgi:hypothetical protein
MKLIINIIFLGVFLFFSCSPDTNTDTRLRGSYVYSYNPIGAFEEFNFSGTKLSRIYITGNIKNKMLHKIQTISYDNDGGMFYAINSNLSDEAFTNESIREIYIYKFINNGIFIQRGDKEGRYYIKK